MIVQNYIMAPNQDHRPKSSQLKIYTGNYSDLWKKHSRYRSRPRITYAFRKSLLKFSIKQNSDYYKSTQKELTEPIWEDTV